MTRRQRPSGGVLRTLSSGIAWSFAAIPIFGVIAGTMALLLNPYTAYLGVAVVCVLVIIGGNAARSTRKRRSRAILAYLTQAVQTNMPIPLMLRAAAQSETPAVARRIDRLRTALEDGSPVGSAVTLAVPHAPQRVIDLTNAADRNGRLGETLGRLLDDHYPAKREPNSLGMYGAYSLILILTIGVVITVLSIFVIPKLQQILHDFHMPEPPATYYMEILGQSLAPIMGAIALLITFIIEGRALRQLLSQARPRVIPLKGVWDFLIWHTPIFGKMMRDRDLADVCTIIANGIDAGRPVEQAIGEAVLPYQNAVLRKRVDVWATLATSGMSIEQAADRARMPALISGLIGPAVRAGNLPGAMRFLSRHYESSFSRAAILLQAAAVPALVLSLGATVLGVAWGLFVPMVKLIDGVAIQTRLW